MPTCLFPGALCASLMCVSLCACVREREGWHWQHRAGHVRADCGLAASDPASFPLLSCSPCSWSWLPAAEGREAFQSPPLGHRCGGTAEEMEPLPLPSSPTVKRLRAVIHFFLKIGFANKVFRGAPVLPSHSSWTPGDPGCPAPSAPLDGTQECPWPAGSGGSAASAEDKSEARGPVQILTVGQSDQARDAGETAAGGGAQPGGQDIRAMMQRKGEPRGGPETPPKAQPQVLRCTFLREHGHPVSVSAPPRPWQGAHLETSEQLGQGSLRRLH